MAERTSRDGWVGVFAVVKRGGGGGGGNADWNSVEGRRGDSQKESERIC